MFGSLPSFAPPLPPSSPPKDVPPPTPVHFPRCSPQVAEDSGSTTSGPVRTLPLTALLQSIVRPTEIGLRHFEALGVNVQSNADVADLIPDMTVVPDFAAWDRTDYEDARSLNDSTRRPICNGNRSPGMMTYLDRKRELSIDNNSAFRSVRRIQPQPGKPLVRLGNAYEFFRHLESFSTFWDDTSDTPPPAASKSDDSSAPASSSSPSKAKANGEEGGDGAEADGDRDSVSSTSSTAVTDSESKAPEKDNGVPVIRFYRSSAGAMMPPEYRLNIITAFLKLVAYDFGCNVSAPRVEPRLYINAGTLPAPAADAADKPGEGEPAAQVTVPSKQKPPSSYFASGSIFIFRSPTTREAARAGIVEGPLAAVSARHTTSFPTDDDAIAADDDKDSCIDLARELVAALLTAQHRAREGRTERRLGEGTWWATKPRWGGGSGGPIGREVDAAPNTDDAVIDPAEGGSSAASAGSSGSSRPPRVGGPPGFLGSGSSNSSSGSSSSRSANKKARKGMAIYDNYRMVRPPSSSWDKKTKYMAIGRTRGVDYDDIFVVSALFHHMSIVRVRVPLRLLQVLDGDVEGTDGNVPVSGPGARSWGRLDVVRSRWFDFFQVEERLAAMRLAWAMMAFLMRKEEEDIKMKDA